MSRLSLEVYHQETISESPLLVPVFMALLTCGEVVTMTEER